MSFAIKIENIYKEYRLGTIGYGTLTQDIQSWYARIRHQPDPNSIIGNESGISSNSSDHILALNNIQLDVKTGEKIGIIGNNGAGKTTLLKILSQIASPTSGSVKINGRVASLIAVGTGMHPELTGKENIYLNGSILGLTKKEIDQRFDEIVDFSGIEKFINTPVKRYSSGMNVRLGFSVASHLNPDVLIIDEVLAVGDAEFQKKCIGKLNAATSRGRTVLFVSHNMLAIEKICTRSILLDKGKVIFDGKPKEAIDFYLDTSKENMKGELFSNDVKSYANEFIKIKAIRIISNNEVTAKPSWNSDIEFQVDYENLIADQRRIISIHVNNKTGQLILTSGNIKSASILVDEWCYKKYPVGLFRTRCIIPKELLNPGTHSISLYINRLGSEDVVLNIKNIITFEVVESDSIQDEYLGKWIGAVRPKLDWQTEQLN
jgi:lipopolysaccharide transport system ATP-binding protein